LVTAVKGVAMALSNVAADQRRGSRAALHDLA
jgi:hypothetical protein